LRKADWIFTVAQFKLDPSEFSSICIVFMWPNIAPSLFLAWSVHFQTKKSSLHILTSFSLLIALHQLSTRSIPDLVQPSN
jgi:hypothetical protein